MNLTEETNRWNGFEDRKLFDDFAWKTLKKLIKKMFTKEKVKVVKIIQNAYRITFWLMQMQSNLSAQESVLNQLRHVLFYEVRNLRDSTSLLKKKVTCSLFVLNIKQQILIVIGQRQKITTMSSTLTEEIDESGTGQKAYPNVSAGQWGGLENWELFDDLLWKTLKKLIKKMFTRKRWKL
jgi:hypothetical protein